MKRTDIQPARQHKQEIADGVRDQKRECILAVAEDLFFRNGYAGTTMADIVNALGVTKPYVYYYFASKGEIFETLCWRASVACLTSMHFDAADNRPATEKLREGLHRFAAANVASFKSGTLFYRDGTVLEAPLKKKLRTLARRFYNELCTLLEEGRDSGEFDFDNTRLTSIAIGSVAGFMYTWYKPEGKIKPDEMTEQLTNILLKIAGAKPAKPAKAQRSSKRS